jgi:hypothetical protein
MKDGRCLIRDASAPSLKVKYKFSNTKVYGKTTFFISNFILHIIPGQRKA